LVLYNPAIEFQTSNNPIDWTVLSYIEMQTNVTWTSRNIPIGTENPIDVLTMNFRVPIWITPPAKVNKQTIIENIITSMVDASQLTPANPIGAAAGQYDNVLASTDSVVWSEYEFLNRKVFTPGNFSVTLSYIGNNQYTMALGDRAGNLNDPQDQATVTFSKSNPTLVPGSTFFWNKLSIPINTTNLATFVDSTAALLINTSYNIQIQNLNQIMFINNTNGDNVFDDGIGAPLINLGLLATTYPGGNWAWWRLFLAYVTLHPYATYKQNASRLNLLLNPLDQPNVYQASGWIDPHPTDQNKIIWTLDTASVPAPTLTAITAIVNPLQKGPTVGLPAPAVGQRYLLTEKPADTSAAWGPLSANANDIIQYNGKNWAVSWSAVNHKGTIEYVINQFTGKLLIWDGAQWSEYILPRYGPGYWRLSL